MPFLFAISAASQQPRFVLTPEIGSADRTAIAAAQSIVMLVWSNTTAVHWQRFDAAGAPLDIAPASIPTSNFAVLESSKVAVAASGDQFLIVWNEHGKEASPVYGLRVAFDGTLRDRVPMTITDNGSEPAVASDGFAFDVVWTRLTGVVQANFFVLRNLMDAVVTRSTAANTSSPPRPSPPSNGPSSRSPIADRFTSFR